MPRLQSEDINASTTTTPLEPIDFAIRLLELQQRVAAFGTLYDEEVTGMNQELTQLKADFVRQYQAQTPSKPGAATAKRPSRGAGSEKAPRKTSKKRPKGSSAQEE